MSPAIAARPKTCAWTPTGQRSSTRCGVSWTTRMHSTAHCRRSSNATSTSRRCRRCSTKWTLFAPHSSAAQVFQSELPPNDIRNAGRIRRRRTVQPAPSRVPRATSSTSSASSPPTSAIPSATGFRRASRRGGRISTRASSTTTSSRSSRAPFAPCAGLSTTQRGMRWCAASSTTTAPNRRTSPTFPRSSSPIWRPCRRRPPRRRARTSSGRPSHWSCATTNGSSRPWRWRPTPTCPRTTRPSKRTTAWLSRRWPGRCATPSRCAA